MKIEKNIPIPHDENKFRNGENNYKWRCIRTMQKMEIGDSLKVNDRAVETIRQYWLWRVERKTGFKFIVKSIDKYTQRIWRIK